MTLPDPTAVLAPPAPPPAHMVGERLYLRPIERQDIDRGWLDWMNDGSVVRHLARPVRLSREDLVRYFEASMWPQAAMLAVCDRADGTYIGNARLSAFDWLARNCTFGWLIGRTDRRGKGHGAEALLLLLRYGFHHLGMHRIYSGIQADNEPSLRSARRVGMVEEGVQREAAFRDGRFVDVASFGMLRPEFDVLHGAPGGPASQVMIP